MSLLIFAHAGDDHRLRSVAALVAAAAASGREAAVVFEDAALRRLAEGDLDPGPAAARGEIPGAAELLSEARKLGGVRVLVCPTAAVAAGVDVAALGDRVDEVMGLARILDLCDAATTTLFV